MPSFTPNINLKKPTTDEYYNVLDENNNKDKIDTAIGNINSQLGKMIVHGVTTASGGSCTITANRNGEYILLFYAGHMTSIFIGGSSTSIFTGGDDPTQYGFTLARNDKVYTITRSNGTDFQYAWLEIIN